MAKPAITLRDLRKNKSIRIHAQEFFAPVKEITIDSRSVTGKECFVAIKGERFDGHDFIPAAVAAGVKVVICNENYTPDPALAACFIFVPDTTAFLAELAAIKRSKFRGVVIGITGSNGKTTTKEILKALLSGQYNVHATMANNNNHIGVPLTIFELDNRHDAAVIEMGTNHFGEIEYLAKMVKPDMAVITNIGPSHLEFLIDFDGVFKEKRALFEEVIRSKGTLIVNRDDKYLRTYLKSYKRTVSFGSKKADVSCSMGEINEDGTQKITIRAKNFKLKADSPLIGEHNALNIASAVAVALKLGLKKKHIKESIAKLVPAKHRLNFIKAGEATIIDDTYNSNPNSVTAALKVLKAVAGKKMKVVALGDMFELGDTSESSHRELAGPVMKIKPSMVLLLGKHMKHLYEELKSDYDRVFHFDSREEYGKKIKSLSGKQMFILLKGSRGMKMEEFISQLTEV